MMLTVFFQALAVAALGILSPGAITVVTLLLTSNRGWQNGVSFLAGYMLMYTLVGSAVLIFGITSIDPNFSVENLPTPSPAILISLGTAFLLGAVWNWRKEPAEDQGKAHSRFIALVDKATPAQSFAFATAIAMFNLKNLTIFLSSVSILLLSKLFLVTKLAMLIPLVLVFSIAIIIPIGIFFAFPEQANERLTTLKNKIDQYNRPLGIAFSAILGVVLFSRGVFGLL